jgi:hypothetical protein
MAETSSSGAAKQTARSLATAYAEIDKLKENNDRLAEQLQLLGGFSTLINVLQNGLTDVVGELQPLRTLADNSPGTAPPGTPLDECASHRLTTLRRSLERQRADSYDSSTTEADVGFLHDTPGGPYPCGHDGDEHDVGSPYLREQADQFSNGGQS